MIERTLAGQAMDAPEHILKPHQRAASKFFHLALANTQDLIINECVTRRTLTTSFFVISMSVAKRNIKIFPLVIAQLMEISPSGRNDETRDVVR